MSEADKMFEKLGYEIYYTYDQIIYQKDNHEICFYEDRKCFDCGCGLGREYIFMQELQAINEKCRELGWLNERR